jgi:S1-C subfamily serine protease
VTSSAASHLRDRATSGTTDIVQAYQPPPLLPQESPASTARSVRSARWLLALTGVLVLAVAGAAIFGSTQAHRLASTRTQLATLRASAASEQAQVSALAGAVAAQQQSVASLGTQLGATQTQLATTQSKLGTTQSQLQTAQTRLGTDEQQLNSTTKQLGVTTKQLPPDLIALATQVSPSVVLLTCTTAGGGDTGTGFALALPAASGYATTIVTAEHVINACTDPSSGAFISLARGGQVLPVHLRAYDRAADVAILDTAATLPTLKPAGAPVVGEFLMAVGNPLGVNNNVTSGNVSQVYPSYFLDSAPISNGSSGGPVVDRSGSVVGIVDAGAVADANTPVVQNLNIALRLSRLCPTVLSGSSCAALH